jgi:hypothetical protein
MIHRLEIVNPGFGYRIVPRSSNPGKQFGQYSERSREKLEVQGAKAPVVG